MKRALILCACVAAMSVACSTTPATEDGPSAAENVSLLDVHEVSVSSPRGTGEMFTIGADGAITIVDANAQIEPGHYTTIKPDGSVTLADGTPFIKLAPDGSITAADGSDVPISIAKDGTTTNANMPRPLMFNADGHMGEEDKGDFAKVTHVTGSDNARARRAVSLAFISVFVYVEMSSRIVPTPSNERLPVEGDDMSESIPVPVPSPAAAPPSGAKSLEDEEPADEM